METTSTDRRAALLGVQLAALVRAHWPGTERAVPATLPLGATLTAPDRSTAWVLPDLTNTSGAARPGSTGPGTSGPGTSGAGMVRPAAALAGAVVWAQRAGVRQLHLIATAHADDLARQAAAFALPVTVWAAVGTELRQARAAALPAPVDPLPAVAAWSAAIRSAGAEPVAEHGLLLAEVLGLEVARVVPEAAQLDPGIPRTTDGTGARLELGSGRYERELHDARHGGTPTEADLRAVVDVVRVHRRAGASPHPANRLDPQRWLRAAVVIRPELAGAVTLTPVPPPHARTGPGDGTPAGALGQAPDGTPLLVVCATGMDPGLIVAVDDLRTAAAAALGTEPAGLRTVLLQRPGDGHPLTRTVAGLLRIPVELRTASPDWQDLPARR